MPGSVSLPDIVCSKSIFQKIKIIDNESQEQFIEDNVASPITQRIGGREPGMYSSITIHSCVNWLLILVFLDFLSDVCQYLN